jgi:phosphatidylserine decarboxylase
MSATVAAMRAAAAGACVAPDQLTLDANLAPLVVFLFMAGIVLWSSLHTGVQTTRVMVRLARGGCKDGSKARSVAPVALGASALGATMQWTKRLVVLSGSLATQVPRRATAAIKRRIAVRRQSKSLAAGPRSPRESSSRGAVSSSSSSSSSSCPSASCAPRWGATQIHVVKYFVPYRTISMAWGLLTRVPLPGGALKRLVYNAWADAFGCLLGEMRHELESYPTLCAFFLRPLKDGVRAVDTAAAMVSPVDGKVLHAQSVPMDEYGSVVLEQVKGVSYKLEDFIGARPAGFEAKVGRQLNTVVLYLSPGDYHHFHSATECSFVERRHFAGALLPVKPSVAHNVAGLYCINERVVLNGTWAQGFFSYVAVGALNVGSIEIDCDPELRTNVVSKQSGCFQRAFKPAVCAVRAEKVGLFNLGSTVVLVFESGDDFCFDVQAGDVVRVGQPLDKKRDGEGHDALPVMCPPWPKHVAEAAARAAAAAV